MNSLGGCVSFGRREEMQDKESGFERDRRKISLSVVSEMLTRANSNEGLRWDREDGRRRLQRRILRTQIVQVVLGITLMVTTAVALIEERTLFGLGFGITTAFASIVSAVVGMGECKARVSGALNGVAFLTLIPTAVFMSLSLHHHFAHNPSNHSNNRETDLSEAEDESKEDFGKLSSTVPILFVIQAVHLLPMGFAFVYNGILFKHLHRYTLI